MKPNRFELPECRHKAILLATDAMEDGTGGVRDIALQWLDCALSDALVDLQKYKTTLEVIAERACPHSVFGKEKTCLDVWGPEPQPGWCYPCQARYALANDKEKG